jgi:hypothetical protein
MTALSQFEFLGHGSWRNAEANVSVSVCEDTHRTFRAYAWRYPHYRFVLKNANGNDIRFRSAEAAAAYALKHSQVMVPARREPT